MNLSILNQVLIYTKYGWPVFPVHSWSGNLCSCRDTECENPAKHPRTKRGCLDATTDERQIRDWWGQMPNSNLGIRTGKESQLVVLDVDAKSDGLETLRELEKKHGSVPHTVQVITGGGGLHYYFRWPGFPVQNRVGLFPGIDLRGDGGYVLAPPSLHRSGRQYAWEVSAHPDETEIAPMPSWLLSNIQDKAKSKSPEHWRDVVASPLKVGQRNATIASLTGHLIGKRVDARVTLALILAWNHENGRPPLSDAEIINTVNSICRRELSRRSHGGCHERC